MSGDEHQNVDEGIGLGPVPGVPRTRVRFQHLAGRLQLARALFQRRPLGACRARECGTACQLDAWTERSPSGFFVPNFVQCGRHLRELTKEQEPRAIEPQVRIRT